MINKLIPKCFAWKRNCFSLTLVTEMCLQKQPPGVILLKGVFKNFAKFTKEKPVSESLFNKVAGLRSAALFKKRLWHSCFPVNFVKFLRTPFSQRTPLYDYF